MSGKGSLIDIIITKKPRSFHKMQGFVTGTNDFHKLIVTVLRSYYEKLPPKNILKLTQIFSEGLDFHAPVKQKVERGYQASLMTKDFSKAIMMKLKAKNQLVRWPSRENFLAFKKAKNKCPSIDKKAKKDYFNKAIKCGVMTNKEL